ncbi:MAG: NUDIX domain-containing protein [Patescibacteria group bacterium]|jgi:ADP-ribose pyrophosphatase YjhB (NUDIX family)
MALTQEESLALAELLKKLEWPMDLEVFYALMRKIVSIPIELCVLDDQNRVLTFYRKDAEYDGHHLPGTVLRDNETVPQALRRLIQSELVGGKVTEPQNIGWVEILRGNNPTENPTRHEISLLFLTHLRGTYQGKGGVFSPLYGLPENTLTHHRLLIDRFRQYLRNRQPE